VKIVVMGQMILASAIAALALPAAAQETAVQDWEVVRDGAAVAAATQYDNGLTIMVRCVGGRSLSAMVAGLPAATGYTRQVATWFEGGKRDAEPGANARTPRGWSVGANAAVAFDRYPAGLARRLREGGVMNLLVPGGAENGRNLRYVLELPESPAAIETVLNACERELEDPRDADVEGLGQNGLPHRIAWARQPRIEYPTGRTYMRGFVTVSCLTAPDGRLEDCILESEQPEDGGFGPAVLRAVGSARLRNLDQNDPLPRSRILFNANFILDDEPAAVSRAPSRLPRR
jgi:hypothetical protein